MPVRPIAPAFLSLVLALPCAAADAPPDAAAALPAPKPAVQVEIAPLPPSAAAALAPAPTPGPLLQASLIAHVQAGHQPTTCTIIDEGRTLLVSNRGDNSVSVFETERMALQRTIVEVGYSAWGILERPPGQVLVANWAGSAVALIDRATGRRLGEIPVGMKPSYLAMSPDGKKLFAAGNFSDDVSISDIPGKRVIRQVEIGRRPMGVAVSPDGQRLYVASCDSKKISVVDVADGVVLRTFGAPLAATTNLVLAPGGRKLLAAGDAGRLLVMDAESGSVDKVPVGADSSSVAVTPDGRVALVADYLGGSVSLVDLPALQRYATVATGAGAIHVETDGHRFYTCNDKAGSVSAFRLEPLGASSASGL